MQPEDAAPRVVRIDTVKPATLPISVDNLLLKTFEGENAIIGSGLLNQGALLVLGGPPKTYKSFLALSLCYHLTTATPVWNVTRAVRGGEREQVFPVKTTQRVLLLEQEIGERDLQNRFKGFLASLPPGEQTLVRERTFVHSCDYHMQLDTKQGFQYIGELIEHVKPNVVIIDPLIEFHTGDENSARDMARTLHGLDELRQKHGFATVLVHHEAKPQSNSTRSGPDNLRGSSVIYGKGDSFVMVNPKGRKKGYLKLSFTLRRGKPIDPLFLTLDMDTLRAQFDSWLRDGTST